MPAEPRLPGRAPPAWPWVLAGAAVLSLPAVANGVPFIYYDSVVYMRFPAQLSQAVLALAGVGPAAEPPPEAAEIAARIAALAPEDRPVEYRGRSVFYRALASATRHAGQLWPLVALQSLAVATTLMILWRGILGRRPGPGFVLLLAGLTLLTPLGYFTGLVMPDALSGLVVLSAALLLLGWARLGALARWFLGALLLFALLSHATHVLLAAGMAVLAAVLARPLARAGACVSGPGLAVVSGAVVAALLLGALVVRAQDRLAGSTSISLPHVTSGLVYMGPGTGFLQRNCPEAGFVLCDYVDRLPMDWIDFLFDERDPERGVFAAATPARMRAISQEQVPFLLAVLADDPGGMALYLVDQTARQLARFGMEDAMIPPARMAEFAPMMPPEVARRVEASVTQRHPALLDALGVATHAAVLAALLGVGLAALRLRRQGVATHHRPAVAVAVALLAGAVMNAMFCGTLAAPYDRFQARLICLVPLAAVVLLMVSAPSRRALRVAAPSRRALPVATPSRREEDRR